jgi:hypothetical protein
MLNRINRLAYERSLGTDIHEEHGGVNFQLTDLNNDEVLASTHGRSVLHAMNLMTDHLEGLK